MKRDIHPEYVETQVSCTCGASFTTRSTETSGPIRADVCSECHPFYTGKQKILDTGGRVARFEARFGKARRLRQEVATPQRRSAAAPAGAAGTGAFWFVPGTSRPSRASSSSSTGIRRCSRRSRN